MPPKRDYEDDISLPAPNAGPATYVSWLADVSNVDLTADRTNSPLSEVASLRITCHDCMGAIQFTAEDLAKRFPLDATMSVLGPRIACGKCQQAGASGGNISLFPIWQPVMTVTL